MPYKHHIMPFTEKDMDKQKEKIKRANRNHAIACWIIIGVGVLAIGFFGWIIYWAISNWGK